MDVSFENSDEDILIQPTRLDGEAACEVGAGPVFTGGGGKGEGGELGDIAGAESRVRGKESCDRVGDRVGGASGAHSLTHCVWCQGGQVQSRVQGGDYERRGRL